MVLSNVFDVNAPLTCDSRLFLLKHMGALKNVQINQG